jgi:peptidoglycan/xylan/chitin deacetylase (PgdA/CDA1 family)
VEISTDVQIRVPILYYHQVAEGISPKQGIYPNVFEVQVDYLRRKGYQSIGFEDLANSLLTGHPLPHRPVIISFDDGYLNTYTTAYPILKKAGFTATTFIVSGFIGELCTWEGCEGNEAPLMTREQILIMSADGFTFGGHTQAHKKLVNISKEEAKIDIEQGKKDLENLLQKRVSAFAFPYGDFNNQVVSLVKECGFITARTVHTDNTHRREDLLKLRCVKINGLTPPWKFKYYLTGFYHLDIMWQEWKKANRSHG